MYLLTCKICLKKYVGQTIGEFRFRWNNYKDNYRIAEGGEAHMQSYLFDHFKTEGHTGFLHDVEISLIDKTDPSKPLEREQFWMRKLNTLVPNGLNVSESV